MLENIPPIIIIPNKNIKDITGLTFGRLTILGYVGSNGNNSQWLCQCNCENKTYKVVPANQLKGNKSCGCISKEISENSKKFGVNHPLYSIWLGIKQRCFNPKAKHYLRYGGRGITVCNKWVNSFESFVKDVGPRPTLEHSLDRYTDQNGNYEPGNTRWATKKEQSRNMSNNHLITHNNKTQCISAWAEELNMRPDVLQHRVYTLGWSWAKALDTSVKFQHSGIFTYKGESKPLKELSKAKGVPYKTVRDRINKGWTIERALETKTVRRAKNLVLNGVSKSPREWADELGWPIKIIQSRTGKGWSDEKTLTTPYIPIK